MEKLVKVEGRAVPLARDNIDTDVIVRIEHLARMPKDQLGGVAFHALRFLPDGAPNPDFPPNQTKYAGSRILVAGSNFGCGSSREAAVWAIVGMGFRVVIAKSFGDIFFGNCFQNGVLPVILPPREIDDLLEQCSGAAPEVVVDLEACSIRFPDGTLRGFEVDPTRRRNLMEGLDDIGLTLRHDEAISAWQVARRAEWPWLFPKGRGPLKRH